MLLSVAMRPTPGVLSAYCISLAVGLDKQRKVIENQYYLQKVMKEI